MSGFGDGAGPSGTTPAPPLLGLIPKDGDKDSDVKVVVSVSIRSVEVVDKVVVDDDETVLGAALEVEVAVVVDGDAVLFIARAQTEQLTL